MLYELMNQIDSWSIDQTAGPQVSDYSGINIGIPGYTGHSILYQQFKLEGIFKTMVVRVPEYPNKYHGIMILPLIFRLFPKLAGRLKDLNINLTAATWL